MTRQEFLKAIDLAAEFVFDPKESLLFTGQSLRDILLHIRLEAESAATPSDADLLDAWKANLMRFRRVLVTSARRGPRVDFERREYTVIRETDAAEARDKCPKGPDYRYPGKN